MISFKPIDAADFQTVSRIDNQSFKKGESFRSKENIANLAAVDPDGCMVCTVDGGIVGYFFCRTFSSVGYIGPVGVDPRQQNRGYGKLMVKRAVEYLKTQDYRIIGLETMPEWGKNIGLYHKSGFRATLPARIMAKTFSAQKRSEIPTSLCLGKDVSRGGIEKTVSDISGWTSEIYPGLDLSPDIYCFLSKYPERILLALEKDEVCGFLAFHPEFNRYAWGAVRPAAGDGECLKSLLNGLECLDWGPQLSFRFHTRFSRLTDLFFEAGYKILADTTCMLLKDRTGSYAEEEKSLLIRAWVG